MVKPIILRQKWIFRSDLQANPNVIYLFGDNEKRVGLGGQAKEMRGEPNAHGIATLSDPGPEGESAVCWTDATYERNCSVIRQDYIQLGLRMGHMAHAGHQVIVVIPADGLGTGIANLKENAPRTFKYLETLLDRLDC